MAHYAGMFDDTFLDDGGPSGHVDINDLQFGAHLLPDDGVAPMEYDEYVYGYDDDAAPPHAAHDYPNTMNDYPKADEIEDFEGPAFAHGAPAYGQGMYDDHDAPMLREPAYDEPEYAPPRRQAALGTGRGVVPSGRPMSAPGGVNLRSVMELESEFRGVFSFPYFNRVQSDCFDDLMHSDAPIVVSAPTGSGKTALFELALIRMIMRARDTPGGVAKAKAVYMAPIKALCFERFEDWKAKFEPLGLNCRELTGDSDIEDYYELRGANLILTTPEKWDSMTRKWRDNQSLVQEVRLFMIDEIHTLNDATRGATIEAVISRMKTVQSHTDAAMRLRGELPENSSDSSVRFVAVSATIPNIEDLAEWLGRPNAHALYRKVDASLRPVPLTVEVVAYPDSNNAFKFDMNLNFKLYDLVKSRGNNKPALIFCSTRKSVQQAAAQLLKQAGEARRMEDRFVKSPEMRQKLQKACASIKDKALRDLMMAGIGYHHAGLDVSDRKCVERVFIDGDLPVLCATSTLAMGVNLPAHLVIIKSTEHYEGGMVCEYSESQILQMMGRAGRPQFDTSATAIIMTKYSSKRKYESLASGSEVIESSLHLNLIEHINAEVVLKTITDVSVALDWIKSTFLFVRIGKNPVRYDLPREFTREQMEDRLQALCLDSLKQLAQYELVVMDDDMGLTPTDTGKLLARYCIAFSTMKGFITNLPAHPTMQELLDVFASASEFHEMRLRVTEKKALNGFNTSKDKPLRYPIKGKIKTTEQKVSCLIQATLGGAAIADFSLSQDRERIFRAGTRIAKCLAEYISTKSDFDALVQACTLARSMRVRLWENSPLVAKQIDKIGEKMAGLLATAGLTSFEKLEEASSTTIELVVGRNPPFGAQVKDAVSRIPRFNVDVEQVGARAIKSAEIEVRVSLANHARIFGEGATRSTVGHGSIIVAVGDKGTGVLFFHKRVMESMFAQSPVWSRKVTIDRPDDMDDEFVVSIRVIHESLVGVDRDVKMAPEFLPNPQRKVKKVTKSKKAVAAAAEHLVPDQDDLAEVDDDDALNDAILVAMSGVEEYASVTRGVTYTRDEGEVGNFEITWEMRDDSGDDGPIKCGHKCANKTTCIHACIHSCCNAEARAKAQRKRKAAVASEESADTSAKKKRKPRSKVERVPKKPAQTSESESAFALQRAKQVAANQRQEHAVSGRMKLDGSSKSQGAAEMARVAQHFAYEPHNVRGAPSAVTAHATPGIGAQRASSSTVPGVANSGASRMPHQGTHPATQSARFAAAQRNYPTSAAVSAYGPSGTSAPIAASAHPHPYGRNFRHEPQTLASTAVPGHAQLGRHVYPYPRPTVRPHGDSGFGDGYSIGGANGMPRAVPIMRVQPAWAPQPPYGALSGCDGGVRPVASRNCDELFAGILN